MPLGGPPIYSGSQVFSLWRVEWFQVFQLPCHRASETGISRAREREETVPASVSPCAVWICLVWSAECRGQSLQQFTRLPPGTSYNMSLYLLYDIYIHGSNEPCDYLSARVPRLIYDFLLHQRRQLQANPGESGASYSSLRPITLWKRPILITTITTKRSKGEQQQQQQQGGGPQGERATAALMGKLPWLMPEPKNSFSRVKVITIYRPQKSVAQHKSKWTRPAVTPSPPPPLGLPSPLPLSQEGSATWS